MTSVSGEDIRQYIDDLARLRIEVFREFPYLYDGDLAYEKQYLESYVKSSLAVVILAKADDQVVGMSTALPLADEPDAFKQPFLDKGWDITRIFYFAESVIRKEFRGGGSGAKFFAAREAHAKAAGDYDVCCFAAVDRPTDHPLRPQDYRPLDGFWERQGYVKHTELQMRLAWKDIDEAQQSEKSLTFWLKSL
jgi:GNAT superfamily N-acetyltransferase